MRNELLEGHSRLSNWLGSVVCLSPLFLSFLFWQTRDVTEPFCFLLLFFCQVCRKNGQRVSPEFRPSMQRDVFFFLFLYPPVPLDNVRRRERQRLPSRWRKPSGFLHLPISHALIFSCVLQLYCFVKRFSSLQDAIFFYFGNSFCVTRISLEQGSLFIFDLTMSVELQLYFWSNDHFFYLYVVFWLVSFRLVCPNRNRDRALHYCPSVTHIKHIIWSLTAFLKNKFSIRFLMIDLSQKICFFSSIILLLFLLLLAAPLFYVKYRNRRLYFATERNI